MIPGIHTSVGGGPCAALETLARLALPAGQVFTSNQQQWKGRTVPDREHGTFSAPGGPLVIAHASYLINLASTRPDVAQKSITALLEELLRMQTLGIRWLVMHPGAHLGAGPEAGLEMVAAGVAAVLEKVPGDSGILFENTAGQGTTLGESFQGLKRLLDLTGLPRRTGVCLDTCHAFVAGYDLSSPGAVMATMDEADRHLGLDRVLAFHMNDSLTPPGSRRDRHARLGQGMIGLAPLRALAELEVFQDIPAVCEAPGTDDDRAEDIRLLLP
jgi:deoxyribonuclease IV